MLYSESPPRSAHDSRTPINLLLDTVRNVFLPRFVTAGGDVEKLIRIRLKGDKGFYFDDPGHLDILRCVAEQNSDIG